MPGDMITLLGLNGVLLLVWVGLPPLYFAWSLAAYVAAVMLLRRLDISSPLVLLTPAIFIYTVSYVVAGYLGYVELAFERELLLAAWLSLLAFTVTLAPLSAAPLRRGAALQRADDGWTLRYSVGLLFTASVLGVLLLFYLFLRQGVDYKYLAEKSFYSLNSWMICFYTLLMILKLRRNGRTCLWLAALVGCVSLLATLILGERDVFFRFAIVTMALFYLSGRLGRAQIAVLALAALLAVPLLHQYKNALVRSDTPEATGLVEGIVMSEFGAAGSNFQTLLDQQGYWEPFNGETVLWAVTRAALPSGVFPAINATRWFNEQFYYEGFSLGLGRGFSFFGEGYINFGYWGIALWYCALALIVAALYRGAFKGPFALTAYLAFVPAAAYAQRGDLSYVLSPLLKDILLPFALVAILSALARALFTTGSGRGAKES